VDSLDLSLEIKDNNNRAAHLEQVKFLNNKMMQVVDQLLNSENPPVIIISSDHGSAFLFDGTLEKWDSPTNEMIKERMNNIMFIYLPSNETDIFYEGMTSVNVFRVLFNYYFETDFEILEDRIFFSRDGSYDFKDVTDLVRST
jgi:glycerophosphoryl diester phosphodiesterase